MLRLKSRLWAFYRDKRRDPEWKKKGSEIWNLTSDMISKKRMVIKAKGAEARGLLEFCVSILTEYAPAFAVKGGIRHAHAQQLLASGEAAMRFEAVLKEHGRVVPREAQLELWSCLMKHTSLYMRSGGKFMPKHHQMMHAVHNIARHGNPRYYHTYRDESLNGVIAKIGRSCHRTAFGLSVHMKFNVLASLLGNAAVELHP
jgi:hypothetical protein